MGFLANLSWGKAPERSFPSVAEREAVARTLGRDERFALPMRPSGLGLPAFVPAPAPQVPADPHFV